MRKFTKLWATLLLLCAINVTAQAEVKIPIELTGAVEGVTVTPIDPVTLEPLETAPENIYAAKFTTASELQNVIQVKDMSTADAVAQGCDRIIIEFGAAVGDAWRFHSYGGQFDGIEELGGKTSHTMMINAEKTSIEDFTIFNWVGSGVQEIIIKAAYFYKPDVVDPLATQKSELSAAIALGKLYNALAYTDATFATLTSKIADGETALAATGATEESLTTAKTDIETAISGLALKDGFSILTADMFKHYASLDAPGEGSSTNGAYELLKASDLPYGDSTVSELNWADLSSYDNLYVTIGGTIKPRFCFNRLEANGQQAETKADSKMIDINPNNNFTWSTEAYEVINGNVYAIDLKKIVEDYTFARRHCIKKQGWGEGVIVSGMYLYKEAAAPADNTEVTWDATAQSYENGTEIGTIAIDEKINAVFDKNTNNNAPKYYTNGTAVRVYGGNTITISGEKVAISKVEFTFGSSDGSNDILADKGTYAEGVWTITENTNIVKFTIDGTTGNRRIAAIKVTYAIDENAAPLPQPVHIANTAETAYTVAEAVGLIDAGEALSETVFVKGIVSQVDKIQDGAITYWISDDGTTANQFECYKGLNIDGAAFAAIEDVEVGAEVIVKGTMKKYGDTYEFNQDNELVSYKAPAEPEQSWIAPTIAGEDPVTDGQYKVMNVGSGKYLAMGKAWFSWATTAIVAEDGFVAKFAGDAASFTLTNTGNGKYVFTSGNEIQGDAMHADGGNATNYGLTKLANGNYHIHDAGGNAESPCWGYNSDFHATGIVAHADATAAGWNCEWIFVGDNAANLYNAKLALYNALVRAAENGVDTDEASAVYAKADATVDELKAAADKLTHATNFAVNTANAVEGADMTYTIVNPSFETGNTNGWTYEASNDHGAKENSNGTYTMANCDGKYLFNIWSSGNLISQTIEDLPNGTYKMKAIIATDADHKVQLNANDKSVQIDAIGKETGVEGELEFDVFNNKATIGAEGVNKYWYKVDNFRLTYVKGIDLSELVTTYETALANAQAVEGIMNAEVKTALETAITANSEVDKTDFNALTDAVTALTDATNAANASIAAYTNAKAAIDAAKAEMAATNVYTAEALEAYKAVYDAAEPKYENRTLTDDEAKALENPKALTGWHDANIVDNLLLSAWDAEADKFEGYYINTWSTEGENDGSEFKVPFFEYWTGDANSLGEKTLTATMTSLPEGEYNITAWVRVRIKNNAEAPAAGITFQANDGEAVNVAAGDQVGTSQMYLKEFTATGTVAEDGVLKIKFNIAADNNISWLSFKNVKFEKKPVEVAHTWDFTKWSEETVANLKADAEADAAPTEASKDNCFWATVTPDENGELSANDVVIEELKGLAFNSTYSTARSLAIAVNYPVALSTYAGPAYLWLGGGGKDVDCFVIKNVKAGTQIKMGVESHKTSEGRGVQLFVEGAEGARGAKLAAPDGSDVAVPSVYEEQTWAVPGEDGVCNIIVYNTKGCHIYFIDAEIGETTPVIAEDPELVAPEGWTNQIANGNLATDNVANFFSKEQGVSTDPIASTIVAGAGKNGSRGIVVKSADDTAEGAQAWDTQFWIKVNEPLTAGTKLHVEFDYAASKAAKASTQAHGVPGAYQHWAAIGDVNFTTEWQHFSKDIDIDDAMAKGDNGNGTGIGLLSIAFNLAEEKTATEYYFDNFGVWSQAPAPVEEWTDLVINGNMEGENMECFWTTQPGIGGPLVATATDGIGKDGSKAVKIQSADNAAQDWDTQFFIRLPYQLPAGTKYKVSFDYKADKAGDFDTQAHAEPGQYIHWAMIGSGSFTTEWQTYEKEGSVPAECDGSENKNEAGEVLFLKTCQTIAFNLAKNKVATEFIFDNVKFEVPADVAKALTLNPSGITTVKTNKLNGTIYNLNGQKMNKAQKGLYIINGKKVVIK